MSEVEQLAGYRRALFLYPFARRLEYWPQTLVETSHKQVIEQVFGQPRAQLRSIAGTAKKVEEPTNFVEPLEVLVLREPAEKALHVL